MSGIEKDTRVRLVNPPGRMVPYGAEGTAESAPGPAGLVWVQFPQGRMHTRVSEVEVIGSPAADQPGNPATGGTQDIETGVRRSLSIIGRDTCAAARTARNRREATYITADGERIAVIVPLPRPMPPGPAWTGEPWTDAAALSQAMNGEPDTPHWAGAWDYIGARLHGCDPDQANARVNEPGEPDNWEDYEYGISQIPQPDEEDEPELTDYDPGDAIDDVGGASEYTPGHPDAYPYGES